MNADYFAELFVAGIFADSGWNVYFPHRDKGFDFIITKEINGNEILRPVQVKGKYPTQEKTNKGAYGYVGALTKLHPAMVLAIPYFNHENKDGTDLIAYMPLSTIKPCSRGFRCEPAKYISKRPMPRPDLKKYFNKEGLRLIETHQFS